MKEAKFPVHYDFLERIDGKALNQAENLLIAINCIWLMAKKIHLQLENKHQIDYGEIKSCVNEIEKSLALIYRVTTGKNIINSSFSKEELTELTEFLTKACDEMGIDIPPIDQLIE